MNIKLLTTTFLFLLMSALPTQAQIWVNSYIITHKNDTLKGKIQYNWSGNPTKEIIFKQNDKEVKYNPSDIQAFGFEDNTEIFVSISFEGEKRNSKELQVIEKGSIILENKQGFAKMLIQGDISLYRYFDSYRAYYFIQKNGEDIEVLKYYKYYTFNENNVKEVATIYSYQNQLNEALIEAPKTVQLTNKVLYQESSLVYLIKNYHKEVAEKFIVKRTPNPLHLGIMGGLTFNKIKFSETTTNEIHLVDFPTVTAATFGISMEKYFDSRRKTFSMYADVCWSGFKTNEVFNSVRDVQAGATTSLRRVWHYKFDFQYLKATPMLRYSISPPDTDAKLFINAGMSYGFSIRKGQQTYYTSGSQIVYQKFEMQSQLSFVGGLGMRINEFGVEMRFERIQFNTKPVNQGGFDALVRGSQISMTGTYWFR